jgi:type IV pilus assembly protein PilB
MKSKARRRGEPEVVSGEGDASVAAPPAPPQDAAAQDAGAQPAIAQPASAQATIPPDAGAPDPTEILAPPDAPSAPRSPEDAALEPKRGALGDLLISEGLIDQKQLREGLLQQKAGSGKPLGQLLVETGVLDERDLVRLLSSHLKVGIANLGKQKPTPEALDLVPEEIARTHTVIPMRVHAGKLEVATADPTSKPMLEQVRSASNMEVVPLIASARDISAMIDRSYKVLVGFELHVEAFQLTEKQRRGEEPLQQAVNENAPVVQVVNLVIRQALHDRASDIHIEPQDDRIRIRYRIDGALHDVVGMPANMGPAVISRVKVLAGMNIVERQRPQDGQFAMKVDGRDVNFRVSTTATIWGEKSVIRILDKSRALFRLDQIGMPEDIQAQYMRIIRSPSGMILCAGPTGSGKTTTLYASLLEINDPQRNIVTIEDPVEYVFPSINQIQVREAAGVTFASGLRSVLRQDPDVLLIGEIRDAETASIAAQSALTGHFVLSSIHAIDSVTALQRFIDMGIEPFVVSSSVLGVVAQRLLRRICVHCRQRSAPKTDEIAFYSNVLGGGGTKHWTGAGCNFCSGTGYQDRIGIFELLRLDEVVKQMVLDPAERTHKNILDYATSAGGMRTLQQQALALIDEGVTTVAEVLRATYALEKA